jgi:hypothetical protein
MNETKNFRKLSILFEKVQPLRKYFKKNFSVRNENAV